MKYIVVQMSREEKNRFISEDRLLLFNCFSQLGTEHQEQRYNNKVKI